MAKPAKKTTGKSLVKWDEEFAKFAKEATAGMELPTAKFLSIRGGKLTYGGADVPDNELRVVVVGWNYENQFYVGKFNPKVSQVPACYAFGTKKKDMAPSDDVPDKQCDTCAECPHNEFGSADNEVGKACKNVLRLALISESDLDDIESAELVYLKVPVTSVKNFLAYATKTLDGIIKRPYWSVITTIKVDSDDDTQVKVEFSTDVKNDLIDDDELFTPLKELYLGAMDGIAFPYPAVAPERGGKQQSKQKSKVPAKSQKFAKKR